MTYWKRILLVGLVLGTLLGGISFLDSDRETLSRVRSEIALNQVGYLPNWPKSALVINDPNPQSEIELIEADSRQVVKTFAPQPPGYDQDTQTNLTTLDFSELTAPGQYYLRQDQLKSAPFTLGNDIYQQPLTTLLRSYYLQRCGVELADPVNGITHAPCHINDGAIARGDEINSEGAAIDAVGGWHNGASYNKYVASTAVTIARLLNLYQQYPNRFPDGQLDIPESDNGVSDLLDEMQFGLDWLLKMQRSDGAVYRKVGAAEWVIGIAPDADQQFRFVYGISTPETAKFAAVMAIAHRTYQPINSELASRYLQAAQAAWSYLQANPLMQVDWEEIDDAGSESFLADQFNTDTSLLTDLDDRTWAAVELYIATGDTKFSSYFSQNIDQTQYTTFSWKNPIPLALVDYLHQSAQPSDAKLTNKIASIILQRADLVLSKVQADPYRLANDNFTNRSNRITIEEGLTLFEAFQLTQNPDYLQGAIAQLDYLWGRNYFNQTFVTGIGTQSVEQINHPFAIAKQMIIPGLVVGGPNSDSPDGTVGQKLGQRSYRDDNRSYGTNQYAIDINASVISLITHLTALES